MATFYDVLSATCKYDGSKTAHTDVIATLKKHGHTVKSTAAWCSETVMAYFYDANAIDLIGGYAGDSGTIRKHAEKLGIWHKGDSGILPGDIVLYGSGDKTNHTEFAVGHNLNISGNYNGGVYRRTRSGRHIVGYVRPRYAAMPPMGNLETTICACDVMLNVYGSGDTRIRNLSIFGNKNSEAIQKEVTRVWGDAGKMPFDFAVYIIAGRAGKSDYRKKRLGSFYQSAQNRVNEILALKSHSREQAVQDVLAGKYGTNSVRSFLLRVNGFDVNWVQEKVNEHYKEKPPDTSFRIYPVWFFEGKESAYGDCTAIIEYKDGAVAHAILIDTAMSGTARTVIKKLKAQGITQIDAVIISHAHGDHYGGLTEIAKALPVKSVYIPNCDGLDKYQKSYANALRRQAAKAQTGITMQVGGSYSIGNIKWKCVYQAPVSALKEHDSHHFVNNQSAVLRFDLGGKIYHSAGDLQNEGNNLLIKAVSGLSADVFKCQWHGDANACNEAICGAVKPVVAFSNYHHAESKGARGTTRKRLEAVGAKVYRNHENGDIYIDIKDGKISVTTHK